MKESPNFHTGKVVFNRKAYLCYLFLEAKCHTPIIFYHYTQTQVKVSFINSDVNASIIKIPRRSKLTAPNMDQTHKHYKKMYKRDKQIQARPLKRKVFMEHLNLNSDSDRGASLLLWRSYFQLSFCSRPWDRKLGKII